MLGEPGRLPDWGGRERFVMAPHLASTNATGKGASLAMGSGESLPLASAHMTL